MSEVVVEKEEKDLDENQSMQMYFHHDRIRMKVSSQDSALFSFYMNMCQSDVGKSKQKCETDTLSEISQFIVSKNWSKLRKQISNACDTKGGGNNNFYVPSDDDKTKGWVATEKPKAKRKSNPHSIHMKECMNRPHHKAQMKGKAFGDPEGAPAVMKICRLEWKRVK